MKKIILVSILSAMCSSMAFAQTNNYNNMNNNNYDNNVNNPNNVNNINNGMPSKEQQFQYRNSMPPHPTPNTPGLNREVSPNWQENQRSSYNRENERVVGQETEEEYFARENQRPDGRRYAPMVGYNIDVVLISNGEVIKKYNIPVKPHQEFMIVNTEETTYVESMQKYNKGGKVVNKPIYAKVTSGSAITGIIMPSRMRDGTVNVHLNVLNNKLLGFEKSCWASRHECTELPQQVLTKQDVVVNTSLNNPVNATEFINSKGNKVQVAFRVYMENNPNNPSYQQRQ